MTLAFYIFPTLCALSVASMNYIQSSLCIYLKYQAMVDSYYEKLQIEGGHLRAETEVLIPVSIPLMK